MTPNEKAEELVEKYSLLGLAVRSYDDCKDCALIAVDEILELPVCWYSKELSDKNDEECPAIATEEYWINVKEEIAKLQS